jgi:hypothetical protein
VNRGNRRADRWSRRRVLAICAVVAVLLGGGLALTLGQSGSTLEKTSALRSTSPCVVGTRGDCSTESASATPSEATSSASPTSTPSSATPSPSASSAKASTGPTAAGACASPTACGFPDASDTGPRTSSLAAHSGVNVEIRTNGETIDGWNLQGSLDVYANNVTVIDSSITSSNWWGVNLRPGYTGLRILHSVLTAVPGAGPDNGGEDYAVSDMGSGSIEVGWDNISVFGESLAMGNGYIHDNYVHGIVPFINRSNGYAHLDAVLSDGDDTLGLTIKHNTILNSANASQGPTSAIGLLPNTGSVSDTTVDDNWLAGGAYTLYGGGTGATNIVVTDNVFSTQYWSQCGIYGPVAYWNTGGDGNVWSNNTFSSGAPVGEPTAS